jgi:hypothetical protein
MISIVLATKKGLRVGDVEWAASRCLVAFVVKPG